MKLLQILFCYLVFKISFAFPELTPFAENSKAFVETLVDKGILKSGTMVSNTLKGLSVTIPVLSIVDSALNIFLPSEMDELNEKIDRNHKEIMNRFDNLEKILERSFEMLAKEVKMVELIKLQASIKTEYDKYESIFSAYGSNETELVYHLNDFITDYRHKSYETQIVNYFIQSTVGSESALNQMYKCALLDVSNIFNPAKTSPNQIMLDLYFSLINTVYKGNALLSFSYSLKDKILNHNSTNDQNYIISQTRIAVKSLNDAFKNLLTTESEKFLTTYFDVRPESNQNSFTCDFVFIGESENEGYGIDTYFYTGEVKAENGYVITGVKFDREKAEGASNKQVLFLQIQVGKLLPSGFINESTVYWQDKPSKTELGSYAKIAKFLVLDDLHFEDCVMTGLQLAESHNSNSIGEIRLRIFGRKYINGTLTDDKECQQFSEDFSGFTTIFTKYNAGLYKENINNMASYKISTGKYAAHLKQFIGADIYEGYEIEYHLSFISNEITLDRLAPLSGLGLMLFANDDSFSGYVKPYLKTMSFKTIF
ncbi:hypothetical protein PVAND_002935 [Polypedilum vanderplanki]|uniref:Uncharacterized protein n=1 Tax=Polypedilum vanderplanki TaxID=319348 RepID=A0A9J6BU76_POLVA|nr:hypothetical protein PVAND_002935 [Polypedilum vanderplanki]